MPIGEQLIQLDSVDSTNDYAKSLIQKGFATNGTAVIAKEQTNGKGQFGKKWLSQKDENIITSIIVDVSSIEINQQFFLLAATAMGCYNFINKYVQHHLAIKWSNDIFYNNKKLGGILIETCTYNKNRYAVIGIGININQLQFDESLDGATSLQLITNTKYNIEELAKELYASLNICFEDLFNHQFEKIFTAYNQHLYKKNELVTLKKENIKFTCTIKGVNKFGELEVENGLKNSFVFGEVQWVM